ncbi:hypothetical protein ABB37_10141 [Leptomonas pyrrhocoris]|uniref:Uncharacterized protein n=1 Tax=Leptomonas pyrrhocoris TaxID=157538 RepID=A0A0N0DQI7_LEPPY|nr:hypothetical protein ABB37_10141 [Leptomonas pyrrhocoris]KPA73072.1 hypothetical protein ABB37_10141 [Leptomonas pyrrhocoris]|eukprot:XP_015651511.1 hypothetical protein ABB37_10141 [Leptomonas pyrrhocoris]
MRLASFVSFFVFFPESSRWAHDPTATGNSPFRQFCCTAIISIYLSIFLPTYIYVCVYLSLFWFPLCAYVPLKIRFNQIPLHGLSSLFLFSFLFKYPFAFSISVVLKDRPPSSRGVGGWGAAMAIDFYPSLSPTAYIYLFISCLCVCVSLRKWRHTLVAFSAIFDSCLFQQQIKIP